MNIELIIQEYGFVAIFLFLLLNGISGLPSSPLVYIPVSIYVLRGTMTFESVVFFGSLGSCTGNILLYECARRKIMLISYLKFKKEKKLSRRKKNKFSRYFLKNPTTILFVGKFIPMIKVVVPVIAGKARVNRLLFGMIMLISNTIWAYLVVGSIVYGENLLSTVDFKIRFLVGLFLGATFYLRRKRQKSSLL